MKLDAVFGFGVELIVVMIFLLGFDGAFLDVVPAIQGTMLSMHEMSLCIVWTLPLSSLIYGV